MFTSFLIFIGLLAAVLVFFVVGYNRLVRLRNKAQTAASDVDVQLQRRHDLVPNLASTVSGYAGHERGTMDEVTEARARGLGQRQAAAAGILADAEAYPALHAEEGFTQLQGQLAGTEQGVAIARQAYNDAVLEYNTALQSFPWVFVAWLASFAPMELVHADDPAAYAPAVRFASSSSSS
jgi:LemA protein